MRPSRSREQLDVLLGRGGIGASRRDAILDRVLSQVESEASARRRWRWPLAGIGLVTATVAVLVVLVPRPSAPEISSFRAKGATTKVSTPSAALECLGATLEACPSGSLVVVRAVGASGFVSAWAEPVGGGERIWYFSAETSSPRVEANAPVLGATSRAVRIGPEHAVGTYWVDVRVTAQAMNRDDLLHLPADTARLATRVVLTIVPPR